MKTSRRVPAVIGGVAVLALLGYGGSAALSGSDEPATESSGSSAPSGEDGEAAGGDGTTSKDGASSGSEDPEGLEAPSDTDPDGETGSGPDEAELAETEDLGDGEPGKPDAKGRQTDVFERLPGTEKSACVNVDDGRDVRSGGFVGGPFDEASASYGSARPGYAPREVRLYWIPLHAASMPKVTITGTGPGGKKAAVKRVTKADTEEWRFYDTTIRLPSAGEWKFNVRAGGDSGCFIVDVKG